MGLYDYRPYVTKITNDRQIMFDCDKEPLKTIIYSLNKANYTLIKKNKIFLIYKEIKMGSRAKSYMRKGFLILYVRKCTNIFTIYEDPSKSPSIWGKL